MRMELQDVRLVEFSCRAPDELPELPRVRIDLDEFAYSFDDQTMLVRHLTKVDFFRNAKREQGSQHTADTELERDDPDPPEATLKFVHIMRLQLAGGSDFVTEDRFRELAEGTLLFLLFPYVRAACQRFAAELSLPPIVLPILRRPIRSLEGRSD